LKGFPYYKAAVKRYGRRNALQTVLHIENQNICTIHAVKAILKTEL